MAKILPFSQIGSPDVSLNNETAISVPYTQIVNRAQIKDPSKGMAPSMGIDRIQVQQIVELQNEFGSSGERVFKALNDDRDSIRFVGRFATNYVDSRGASTASTVLNDFIEVTFYGTGLSLLTDVNNTARDWRATIDGGSEGSNFIPTANNAINSRGYAVNQVVNIVSNLTSGLHTIKIRNNNGAETVIHGFEILNERSDIRVNQGSLIKDQRKVSLASAQALAYKPSALTGTKGGRVVLYNQGGVLAQAVQAVDASAVYGNSANHNNEDIARAYFFREFGAGRSDDFSRMPPADTAATAFTLDDGTTTLVAKNCAATVNGGSDILSMAYASGSIVWLTFVGTGLDVEWCADSSGTNGAANAYEVYVNGTLQFNWTTTSNGNGIFRTQKIVSGLPYGTHIVKFQRNTVSTWNLQLRKFNVYQPKKPAIPAGAVELADYNVVADFVANATAGLETIPTGILRKYVSREMTYVGTWTGISMPDVGDKVGGQSAYTSTAGAYVEYTFFGTGFETRFLAKSDRATNVSVQLQSLSTGGSLQNATVVNFPSMVTSVYGTGVTYSAPTLDMQDGAQTNGAGFRLSGLTLGMWKLRFTNNSGGSTMDFSCFDIITPIHSHKNNALADLQNTLPIGSQSLGDMRPITMDRSKNKAWAQAVGIASSPTTTITSPIPCPDLSCTIKTSGNPIQIDYSATVIHNNVTIYFVIFVDGVSVGTYKRSSYAGSIYLTNADSVIVPVSAGTHKVDLYWMSGGGTAQLDSQYRSLTVKEI